MWLALKKGEEDQGMNANLLVWSRDGMHFTIAFFTSFAMVGPPEAHLVIRHTSHMPYREIIHAKRQLDRTLVIT